MLNATEPIKNFRSKEGLVYFKGRIYAPANKGLRDTILRQYHDAPASGHQGIEKTIERLRRTYFWPGMTKAVKEYVTSCDSCFRNKAHKHKEYGRLQSLPTPTKPGQQITLDFIMGLPNSNDLTTGVSYDGILSVVERLNKYTWFIPWKSQWDAKEFAQIYLQKLYPEIGVPEATITDRDTKFTSTFWQTIASETGINTKLSTAYHPQTDGQTERANQTVQQYLRAYVDYRQTNWVQHLPLAQFAYNSSINETTKMSPHYARFGHELEAYRGQYENTNTSEEGIVTATTWKHIVESLQDEIEFQNQRRKQYYDNKRQVEPSLKKGDEVYLLRRNIATKRPSSKLDYKKLGPFRISKKINNVTFKLNLPKTMKIHDTFHISLLEPKPRNMRESRNTHPPEVENEEDDRDETHYEVEKLLSSEYRDGQLHYLVKWKDYPGEDSWEPAYLLDCHRLIRQFYQKNPD